MDRCNCVELIWPGSDIHMKYQYVSDFFIALAYFSIPLELIYFVQKSPVFPYRWVLAQFGAFIILCGATHFITLWTFTPHARNVALYLTIAKVLTAVVSCATALMLVHIIPDLLSVKTREHFLKHKAAELDREMGLIRTQEETGRHVRMLTHEIRSSLDRPTILNTTLVELGKALALEDCTLWMPTRNGMELQLAHRLGHMPVLPCTVSTHHPTISQVFSSNRAIEVPPNSPVASTRHHNGKYSPGDVVAVRVPLLHLNSFCRGEWLEPSKKPYALMVLMLPSDSARRWHVHEKELVEVVADQVAVALSHAAILEETLRARDLLMEQNVALDTARREAEAAACARDGFLAVMNHEMRTPLHAIMALSSLLQETELTAEQRQMVETIVWGSNLLTTLITDVLELSRMKNGSLQLDTRTFNLTGLLHEVWSLVQPIASVKKLGISLNLATELPEYVIGDDKRLMQIALNVVGNAMKSTREGSVTVTVSLEKPEFINAPKLPDFLPKQGEQHCYVRVQVKDTGCGLNSQDLSKDFHEFVRTNSSSNKDYGRTGLRLAICKRLVTLMDGHIWIESEGVGKGSTATFIVRLDLPNKVDRHVASPQPLPAQADFSGVKVLVTDNNRVSRMASRQLLVRLGCNVSVVGSGQECLKYLLQSGNTFRIMFLEIFMPDMDGFELMAQINAKIGRHERPLIVALTTNIEQATPERCLTSGMDGVILKPLSLEKMRTILTELLEKGSLMRCPRK